MRKKVLVHMQTEFRYQQQTVAINYSETGS